MKRNLKQAHDRDSVPVLVCSLLTRKIHGMAQSLKFITALSNAKCGPRYSIVEEHPCHRTAQGSKTQTRDSALPRNAIFSGVRGWFLVGVLQGHRPTA
jgi:hypothetical protein